MVWQATTLENHREHSLDRRLDDHALIAHPYVNVGATLHNLNLATYVANSHMKATSTIRP